MGILDKLMFWKKDEDEFKDIGLGDKGNLAFGDEFNTSVGAGFGPTPGLGQGMGQSSYGQQYPQNYPTPQPSMPSYPPPQFQQQPRFGSPQEEMTSKNLEIISSKLDALRASIESLNQRLANLEAIARGEEDQSRRRRYY